MKIVHNRSDMRLILVTAIIWLLSACDSSELFNDNVFAGYPAFDSVQEQLVNVKSISATENSFAALKEDGTVVTWGASSTGGNSDTVKEQLINVGAIYSTEGIFAAVLYN